MTSIEAEPPPTPGEAAAGWDRYLELNGSFGRPFVFHLSRRGFFSEVNVLMDAILFGLVERRRLAVRQVRFNDLRWEDYYASELPPVRKADWDEAGADSQVRDKSEPFYQLLTWTRERRDDSFEIPELDLRGGQMAVRRGLYRMLCRATPEILAETEAFMARTGLTEGRFAAVHVRRGDKVAQRLKNGRMWSEGEDTPVSRYVELIRREAPSLSDVFVMTDDHAAVEALAAPAHGLRVLALCPPEAAGHDQPSFNLQPVEVRRGIVRRLVIETEIAARSGFFAGGFKSNVARYVATVHTQPDRCASVDAQTAPWEGP